MTILVTGGTGYIGSHTVTQLIQANEDVIILDNLSNSNHHVTDKIKEITGKKPTLLVGDIKDRTFLKFLFKDFDIEAVIHFAGLKSVSESELDPLAYYDNNVAGTITLLQAMKTANVKKFIFSSSATVYGEPQFLPFTEDHPTNPVSVYGKTKLIIEKALEAMDFFDVAILRYFNPIGAHYSGLIGEEPKGKPNNLMPAIGEVFTGKKDNLSVFGGDYDTFDGTAMRDYIHVDDVARGHINALKYLRKNSGLITLNLGTGKATSVFEMLQTFKKVSGTAISFEFEDRRQGDLPIYYASSAKALKMLNWAPVHNLETSCKDYVNYLKNISKNA